MSKKVNLILLAFLLFALRPGAAQEVLDKVVAVVDDKIILQSELNQFAYQTAMQLGLDPRKEPEKFEVLTKNALENLVDQKVLLTKAQEDSLVVDERQVDQVLEDRIKSMIQQVGSEEKLVEYFGQPMRKIRRTLRTEIADALLVRTLQQKKFREMKVTRREVEQFYHAFKDSLPSIKASVKLSHILFSIQPGDDAVAAAREKIDGVLKRIRAGEDFAKLAGEYSEDPGSSKRGGELGFIQRGDFVREFEEVAFALQPGEISEVVQSQFGFHVIQLIDRRGEKINARHILIRVATTKDDEAKTLEKLQKLREDIVGGKAVFEEAAKQLSSDKTTNEKGGSLGWFEIDQLQVVAFREVARTLTIGEISQPIKTEFGYHLIRLDERREPRQFSLTEDWQQLEEMALNHKSEREFRAWLESLKEQMYVRIADKT
jgi:peptidyl-prolyl cis-trans isomerase SurA